MLSQLKTAHKVAGAKQVKRVLLAGRAFLLVLAQDADPRVTEPLARLAGEAGVPVASAPTMKELGAACGRAVGCAAAAVVK